MKIKVFFIFACFVLLVLIISQSAKAADQAGLFPICQHGKCGYVNSAGEIAIPLRFDDAGIFSEGLARVKIGIKWGFINPSGKVVIQPKYDGAWIFSEGLARVEIGGKWGYINRNGKMSISRVLTTPGAFPKGWHRCWRAISVALLARTEK